MSNKYLPLRMMVLASLPCVGSYYPSAFAEVSNLAVPEATTNSTAIKATAQDNQDLTLALVPTFVGIVINGQEQDNLDVLLDLGTNNESANTNDNYLISISDLSRLTAVRFSPTLISGADNAKAKAKANKFNNVSGYKVNTPIGDTELATQQVISYQGQNYIALSTLKKMGISAEFSPPDLAIILNMGWQPSQQSTLTTDSEAAKTLPIDYYPSRAGLLGLSFNSTLTASESGGRQGNDHGTSRQLYADIGAFGYGLGGVWGIKGSGYDTGNSTEDRAKNRNQLLQGATVKDSLANEGRLAQSALKGLTYLPSNWDRWQVDNLYWAKSGTHLATRLGINQPNALGQGAQISGSEFTGGLVAYSNRDISRHLSQFDDDSRSLLQNTSQDYQHLSGIGEAGGVAELRINGRALARVQIGLDGRYEFLNLDVSQLSLTDTMVEVAIYAYPLAQQPLEVRPIFIGKRRTNVATNELLIEAGIGRTGNLIQNRSLGSSKVDDSDPAAHLYAEYGISNRLAVRGGVNSNIRSQDNSSSLSWHAGANLTPSVYSNADLSYAHSPNQDLWQAQLQYQRKNLWANYQYQGRQYQSRQHQARQYDKSLNMDPSDIDQKATLTNQRHQLLLNYRPADKTSISLNQYYHDRDSDIDRATDTDNLDNYYVYGSINHRINNALDVGLAWDSRDDRYSYRLFWQGSYRDHNDTGSDSSSKPYSIIGSHHTVGLSGDSDSDTLSLRHQINDRTSLGQSISHRHSQSSLLYQGDVSYRFHTSDKLDSLSGSLMGIKSADNSINIGYSAFDNQVGWLADWQLTHRNGVSFSLGYKHRYVDAIPSRYNEHLGIGDSTLIGNHVIDNPMPAWSQNNYLYAKLSFDMFKPPKQRLRFGSYPIQRAGSVIVDIAHPADVPIDQDNMRFKLGDQSVEASLISSKATHSQYLIGNIKAGDYTLTTDAENLPLEYSTGELPTPRIRISNYAPTTVPVRLQKTYGISGKLADGHPGVAIDIYQGDNLIQSTLSGSFGYFQAFGLAPDTYTLKAQGYEAQSITITDDFIMQLLLKPISTH